MYTYGLCYFSYDYTVIVYCKTVSSFLLKLRQYDCNNSSLLICRLCTTKAMKLKLAWTFTCKANILASNPKGLMEFIICSEIQVLLMMSVHCINSLVVPIPIIYWSACIHFVTGCSLHEMPSQITLETIPVDVLCEIWEVFDNVEHLTCERVSDPHKVCRNWVVCDLWMLWGSILLDWDIC